MNTTNHLHWILIIITALCPELCFASDTTTVKSDIQIQAAANKQLAGFRQFQKQSSTFYRNRSPKNKRTSSFSFPGYFELALDSITDRPNSLPPELDRSGRQELITASMAYSLLYYGWAVPLAFNAESGRPYVASYMLLGGGGFFVPFLLTRENTITQGMARGFTNGAGLGIAHGWALSIATMGEDIDGQTGLGISVASSLAEGIITLSYAKNHGLDRGHMALLGAGGSWAGALAAPIPYFFNSDNPRAYAISGLLGSGIGLWAGNHLAYRAAIAEGDPTILSTGSALGAYLGLATAVSLSDDFNKGSLALLMTGTAVGLGLGFKKIKRLDYTSTEGNLIFLGAVAGGLIGLGTVYVAADNAGEEAYFWGSNLGALGGFILTDRLIKNRKIPDLGTLHIRFNPVALCSPRLSEKLPASSFLNPGMQASLFQARIQF